MRRMIGILAAVLMIAPASAQSGAEIAVRVAQLTFEVCAPALERGARGMEALAESAAAQSGLRVSQPSPLSALPSDMGPRFARMLGGEPTTQVRMIGPRAQAPHTFVASIVRADAEGCVVVAQDDGDTLDIVRARLAQASATWAYESARNGARLYRRVGSGATGRIRLVLAPRQNGTGWDQIILFRDSAPPEAQPEQ